MLLNSKSEKVTIGICGIVCFLFASSVSAHTLDPPSVESYSQENSARVVSRDSRLLAEDRDVSSGLIGKLPISFTRDVHGSLASSQPNLSAANWRNKLQVFQGQISTIINVDLELGTASVSVGTSTDAMSSASLALASKGSTAFLGSILRKGCEYTKTKITLLGSNEETSLLLQERDTSRSQAESVDIVSGRISKGIHNLRVNAQTSNYGIKATTCKLVLSLEFLRSER